jgi:hypothetical protein
MKMKMRWKIGAIIGLVAIIAMAAIGISYAANGNPNPGNKSLCTFAWVEPNDNGATANHDGFNPVDVGDNTLDPQTAQSPGVTCDRYISNAASTSATYTDDTITFSLNTAYPGYHPTIFFGISNQWNTPGIVTSITLNNPNPSVFALTLKGVSINQVIESGKVAVGALDIAVNDNLAENSISTMSATIIVTQYVTQGQNKTNTY